MIKNISFTGNLDTLGLYNNISEQRRKNIEKIFKQETKGINYESFVSLAEDRLFIQTDRAPRKNQKYDYISDFTPREILLTKEDSKNILSRSDKEIAKFFANFQKFVQAHDNTVKKADESRRKVEKQIDKILKNLGVKEDFIDSLVGHISTEGLASNIMRPKAVKFCDENNLTGIVQLYDFVDYYV